MVNRNPGQEPSLLSDSILLQTDIFTEEFEEELLESAEEDTETKVKGETATSPPAPTSESDAASPREADGEELFLKLDEMGEEELPLEEPNSVSDRAQRRALFESSFYAGDSKSSGTKKEKRPMGVPMPSTGKKHIPTGMIRKVNLRNRPPFLEKGQVYAKKAKPVPLRFTEGLYEENKAGGLSRKVQNLRFDQPKQKSSMSFGQRRGMGALHLASMAFGELSRMRDMELPGDEKTETEWKLQI